MEWLGERPTWLTAVWHCGYLQCRSTEGLVHARFEEDMAFGCNEHAPFLLGQPDLLQYHNVGGCCNMPGALWLFEANVCVLDDSGQEITGVAEGQLEKV